MKPLPILALAFALATGGSAQQPPPAQPSTSPAQQESQQKPQEQPVFRAGINFVRVDVIVTDKKGTPVTDLTAADFDVREDGVPQTVETFKLVRVGVTEPGQSPTTPRPIRTADDEEREASREDVRLVVFFLDDYHVRRGASMVVREPLTRFIQNQLSPHDLIAIMYPLTPLSDVQFTRDHEAIIRAIHQFDGRKFDYRPRNAFEDRYSNYPSHVVETIRNQVSLTALRSVAVRLGALREGRKALILVSEGFTALLPPQMRDPVASLPGLGNPNRNNPFAGEGDRMEQWAKFTAEIDLITDMREVWDAANRSNTAIYAVDPRGLAGFEYDINEGVGLQTDKVGLDQTLNSLRTLASETDGRAIVNRNDLDVGMKQIIRDSSAYYLIGYNSTQAPTDGKFHKIDVRLKRKGLDVRSRKGYWALTAEDTARALSPASAGPRVAPEVTEALAALSEPKRGRVARTWIGTARGESGKPRVTLVWEAMPAVPGTTRETAARVNVMASGEKGQAYFRGRVPDQAMARNAAPGSAAPATDAAAGTTAAPPSGPSRVVFDAEPGELQMRLSIEGAAGQVLDTEMRDVTVPDFTATAVSLSTPEVLRARNALEFRAVSGNPDSVPTAGREFRRTDRLIVRFEVYGAEGTTPTVAVRLLNRGGTPMSDVPVQQKTGAQRWVDLPLSSLAAGDYLMEIKATAGDKEAKQLVAIKVTS
jgi:VWFA-related protein